MIGVHYLPSPGKDWSVGGVGFKRTAETADRGTIPRGPSTVSTGLCLLTMEIRSGGSLSWNI